MTSPARIPASPAAATPRASHLRGPRRGVTLPELMMVIVVVGILAALVLPKVKLDNAQVDTAARTIGMTLMAAQRDAASRQHNVIVVFDTSAHIVRAIWDENNNGKADANEKSRPFLIPERVVLGRPSGVAALGSASASIPVMNATSKGPALIVQRNGAVDRSVTLYLSTIRAMNGGTDKDTRAVVIARATGRPNWYAWTGTKWRRGL
jgi:prepilin-type N-terminal cleavage/methylation domain-containing protein